MSSDALVNKQESGTNYSAVVPSDNGEVYEKVSEDDARALMTDSKVYKQYKYRWVVLITFFLAISINGLPYETFIPISKSIGNIYGVEASVISLTATIYMLMHPIFSFSASQIIVLKGFAYATKLGSLFTIIGLAIRLLVNQNFYTVIIGQVVCGIGRPLILNGQASMAQNWFFPSQRTLILTLANVVQTLSIVLSLMVPARVFTGHKQTDTDGNDKTFKLMQYELYAAVLVLPTFLLLSNQPKTPPSAFANTDVSISFKEAFFGMFSNRGFVLTFLANSIYFGTLKGFGVVVPYLLGPYGYTPDQIASTGSLPIIGGMVSSVFISSIVIRVGSYKPIIIVLMLFSTVFTGLFYLALLSKITWVVYTDAFFLGFFLIPMIPVMIELSCELVYPLSSSFAVGMLFSGATLFTVISSQVLTVITKGNDSDETSIFVGIVCIVGILIAGFIMLIFVKEVRNRQKEVAQRKIQSTFFFNHATPKNPSKFGKFQGSELLASIGDLPTYYPFIDCRRMLSAPEVFDPDEVQKLDQSMIKESSM